MCWTFARDLMAVNMNSSGIGGMSLLRESNNFAFQNTTTPQTIYLLNNTLTAPLNQIFTLFSSIIGPFGCVDLIYVPVPPSIFKLTKQILEGLIILCLYQL
ncbi:hypothetical protein THRCLA_00579 [Thraustotheca clavata]|uniref:Uncharacterized protein n=1 Tax=Thraustotheca clavata TaxID=74557 RepID=A0A1W0AAQ7_9STRA|nr:hypothetical protein THRCLA_00579 [Thraustotheca clavata]